MQTEHNPPSAEKTLPGDNETSASHGGSGRVALDKGALVGRYVIVERVGAGGMGVVYAAYDPSLDRKIALKLIAPGGGTEGDIDDLRLFREAQALAQLSHPNVVAVHDVGRHEGAVFVAMEFIEGQTLTAWLREQRRKPRDVLEVFMSAGEGVAAAHAAGLVHRDFKPDNVMISLGGGGREETVGRVRVMDFGLARVAGAPSDAASTEVSGESALRTPVTQACAVVGTPAYMAPEQHLATATDARTDQFSFCVALYEALYGERPFAGDTLAALAANVVSGQLQSPPRGARVRSGLRRVLTRGLAADPDDRWPSMAALLGALRHQMALPRRRLLTAGTGVVALTMAGVVVGMRTTEVDPCADGPARVAGVWDDARKDALRETVLGTGVPFAAQTWDRLEPTLDAYAAELIDGHRDACEDTHVRKEQSGELLDLRMSCLDGNERALSAYVSVLSTADAESLEHALRAARELPGFERCKDREYLLARVRPPADPDVAARVEAIRARLAEIRAQEDAGRYAAAAETAEALHAKERDLDYVPVRAEIELTLGDLRLHTGSDDAVETLEQAYFTAREADHDELAYHAALSLAFLVGYQGADNEQGQRWLRHAKAELGPSIPAADVGRLWHIEGILRSGMGEYDAALEYFLRAVEQFEAALGPDHPKVAAALHSIGTEYSRQRDTDEALRYLQRAYEIEARTFGPEHPTIAYTLNDLANCYEHAGEIDRAIETHAKALEIRRKALGDDHYIVAESLTNLGLAHVQNEDYDQAIAYQKQALALRERTRGREHPSTAGAHNNLAYALLESGDAAAARPHYAKAVETLEAAGQAEHPSIVYPLLGLARCALAEGDPKSTVTHGQRALDVCAGGQLHDTLCASVELVMAKALLRLGQDDRGLALARKARDVFADHADTHGESLAEARALAR